MAHSDTASGSEGPQGGTQVPSSAIWLGGTGALPFVALLAATVFGPADWIDPAGRALALYGAVILSFLGGIQWGLAIATPSGSDDALGRRLAVSVLPSLIGWGALLLPLQIGLYVLAAAFALVLFLDAQTSLKGEAPAWYPKLRLPLTAVVMTCLVVGALFTAI